MPRSTLRRARPLGHARCMGPRSVAPNSDSRSYTHPLLSYNEYKQPLHDFAEVPKGLGASVGFINLGSPMGLLSSKSSAQQTALQRRATPGPAQIPNDRPEERSSLRPEGLVKEGTTLASDSDLLFRSGTRRTSAYSSSPTGAVRADWEGPTRDARSVRTQESGRVDKARRSSQP